MQADATHLFAAIRLKLRQVTLPDLCLALALVLVTSAITWLYVSQERTFYHWDFGRSQYMTAAKAAEFREWPGGAVNSLRLSFSSWYNELFTIPLVPFMLLFGDSRLVFVLSVALVYQVPLILAIGILAVKMIPFRPRLVFWSAVAVALSTPQVWVPTLRGFPDIGAAFLIAAAIIVFLHDTALKHWWQIVLIGFCVAIAMLLRRAFAYSGVAVFVSITLFALMRFATHARDDFKNARRQLVGTISRIAMTALFSLIVLAAVAWPFLYNILTQDYRALYISAYNPPSEGLGFYIATFGWGSWALTVLGVSVGAVTRTLRSPVAQFIALFGSYSLAQWILIVGQTAPHFTLQFTTFVVLGVIAAVWTASLLTRGPARMLALAILIVFLATNAVIGLTPVAVLQSSPIGRLFPENQLLPVIRSDERYVGIHVAEVFRRNLVRSAFSENHPPEMRRDYDEIRGLVEYLRGVSTPSEPIYVASSSIYMNEDLIRQAELTIYGKDRSLLNIFWTEHVDSYYSYPLEKLLEAQYVILATPLQTHQRIGEQDLVEVVGEAFAKGWEIAQDFQRLPPEFRLANGAVATIYRRTRATSLKTVLQTFDAMREFVGPRPGGQLDWIVLSGRSKYWLWLEEQSANTYSVSAWLGEFENLSTSLLYVGEVQAASGVRGIVVFDGPRCRGVELSIASLTSAAEVVDTARLRRSPNDFPEFALALQKRPGTYLLFTVEARQERSGSKSCRFLIDDLSVS